MLIPKGDQNTDCYISRKNKLEFAKTNYGNLLFIPCQLIKSPASSMNLL